MYERHDMKAVKRQGRKSIHLICNAHLDPVWTWQWEEGAANALSTFRTAAELCEKNALFVFNHNEAILYEWVQQYEPELFRRIQALVKQGKWHIMSGWHLQPDCNMPSGESFVRQILAGRQYFRKYFDVEPTTAINLDPFGHTRGLVQILARSGYDSYLFGRPDQNDCPLPADEFVWVGYDGSEVMATRFTGWYNSPLGKAREKIEKWLEDNPHKEHCMVLWGVGDHGGGPSKRDLRDVNRLISQNKEYDIQHSTPEAFFEQLRRIKDSLPRHRKDINYWAPGCYTSQIRVKQKYRLLENEIYMAEKMSAATAIHGAMKYPADALRQALHDLVFAQFHDILPGSSIQRVEEDSLRLLDHGLEITARLKARAFFALGSGQCKSKEGVIPILVYNSHPHKVKQMIECEFNLADFNEPGCFTQVRVYNKGKLLPCQVEHEASNLAMDFRKKVVFIGTLAPSRMNRFDCRLELLKKKPHSRLKQGKDRIFFETKDLEVIINLKTGLVDRYRVRGVDFLGKNSFQPVVLGDCPDPWDMLNKDGYRNIIGRFALMGKKAGTRFSGVKMGLVDSVRTIEDGPARRVIEAVFAYGDSFICQRYKLPGIGTEIEVETRVYWNEKDQLLKLSMPVVDVDKESKYLGQVAYGVAELPNNGREVVAQKWVAVVNRKKDKAFTCINDGTYGSDFSDKGLRPTLLRSPAYTCSPWYDTIYLATDRHTPRIDQGERLYRFWLNAGTVSERLRHIGREALVKNEKPFALSFYPPGSGKKPKPLAVLRDDVVQITTIKKAEKGKDFIFRLFEPTGRKRSTILALPWIGKTVKVELGGFEIKTLKVNSETGRIDEVDLQEKIIRRNGRRRAAK